MLLLRTRHVPAGRGPRSRRVVGSADYAEQSISLSNLPCAAENVLSLVHGVSIIAREHSTGEARPLIPQRGRMEEISNQPLHSPEVVLRDASAARTEALAVEGLRCMQDGSPQEAVRLLTEAIQTAPENARYRLDLAGVYQRMAAEAAEDPDRADELLEAACRELLGALRVNPDLDDAYYHLGSVYQQMQLPWRAREMWNYYLELSPDGAHSGEVTAALDGLERRQHLQQLCDEACYLINHGDAERAVPILREITNDDPEWYEAWFWLGLACRELEMLDDGIRAFDHAIGLDPESQFAHHELASLLARKGEREAAEGFWRKAMELDSEETWIMASLALLLWRDDRRREAETLFVRALEIDPASRKMLRHLRSLRAGEAAPQEL